AIFIHPWEMMGQQDMQRYWLPWLVGMPAETSRAICSLIFGGVFEKFPKLRVAFAHGGGSFPFTFGRSKHGFDVRPDLVATDNATDPTGYAGGFCAASLVHGNNALEFLIDLIGEDKICVGSDYPFPLGEQVPGEIIEKLKLDKQIIDKIKFINAQNWLGQLT